MSFELKLLKYVLCVFNLLFLLGGMAILGIGVSLKLHLSEMKNILEGKIDSPPDIFIIVGAMILAVAFLGCCGSIRQSHYTVITYAVLLLAIITIQATVSILVFIYIGNADSAISTLVNNAFLKGQSGDESAKKAFDAMQTRFQCCGVADPSDYAHDTRLPQSCCFTEADVGEANQVNGTCTLKDAYAKGCSTTFTEFVKLAGTVVAGVAAGVAGIEILTVIFAFCLASSIHDANKGSHYSYKF